MGVVGAAGAEALGLGVGNEGSVGPRPPGLATGLPSMVVLHPAMSTATASGTHPALGNNRNVVLPGISDISKSDYAGEYPTQCSDALLE